MNHVDTSPAYAGQKPRAFTLAARKPAAVAVELTSVESTRAPDQGAAPGVRSGRLASSSAGLAETRSRERGGNETPHA
jgi:hypothetical protein